MNWPNRLTFKGRMRDFVLFLKAIGVDIFSYENGFKILDTGCSYGTTTYELSNLFPNAEVTGIDLNFEIPSDIAAFNRPTDLEIKERSTNSKVRIMQADMFNLPDSIGAQDVIIMANNVLISLQYEEFDPNKLANLLLSAILRLNEGGSLVIFSDRVFLLLNQNCRSVIVLRKVSGKIELIGDEQFYDRYFFYDFNLLLTLVNKLNQLMGES